jgi:hypothetical protein
MVSVFFSKAKTSATLGTILYFGSFFIYYGVAGADYAMAERMRAACVS